jgi:protein-S-isoprenylcysteine O-methyltransferase Ste14
MFRAIAAVIFLVAVTIGGYFRYQSERAREPMPWKEEGPFVMVALRLSGLVLWLSVIIYLVYPPAMQWGRIELPEWARWVGVAGGVISLPMMYSLFRNIGRNISQTVGTRRGHQLVTTGMYRWVRHPLYSVGTLLFMSFALMAENLFMVIIGIIGFILLWVRLPKEEENLIARFGDDYRDYMKRTGRFVPKLRAPAGRN